MRLPKLLAPLFAIFILGAALPSTTFAQPVSPVSDVFVGTATSGAGQLSPVDVNPADITVNDRGWVGIGYTYRANGQARGEVPGRFEYIEHGYLFFLDPRDPTTFQGGHYAGGVFNLTPADKHRAPISIVDTDPSAYRSGSKTLALPGGHGVSDAYASGLKKLGLLAPGGNAINYGYFTFTNKYGTQTGYATPDFRTFIIRLKFDA